MEIETGKFFAGAALFIAAALFALGSDKIVGVKLARYWFVVSGALALLAIHILWPHVLPDLMDRFLASGH